MSAAPPVPTPSASSARQGVARCLSLLPTAARIVGELVGEAAPAELLRLVEALALIGDGETTVSTSNEVLARVLFPGQYPGLDDLENDEARGRALRSASRQVRRYRERAELYLQKHGMVWMTCTLGWVDDDDRPHPARFNLPILDELAKTYAATRDRRPRAWRDDPQLALEQALRPRLSRLCDDKQRILQRHPDAREQRAQTAAAKAKAASSHLAASARLMREAVTERAVADPLGDPNVAESALRASALDAYAILAERAAGVRRSPRTKDRRDERGHTATPAERIDALALVVYVEVRTHGDPAATVAAVFERVCGLVLDFQSEEVEPDGEDRQSGREHVPQVVHFSETKCEEQETSADEGRTDLSAPLALVPPIAPGDDDDFGGGGEPPDETDIDDLFDVYDVDPYRPGGPVEIEQEIEQELDRQLAVVPAVDEAPRALPVQFGGIPSELKAAPRWVVWRYEERSGKPTKVPYQPDAVENRAKVNDPRTWNTYERAVETLGNTATCDGLGFMLGDGWAGFDLDKIRDAETGELDEGARLIVEKLATYTEVSPSGIGVKGIVRGTLPPEGRRKGLVEIYDKARFFTVTGCRLEGTPTTVEDRTAELAEVHGWIFGRPEQQRPSRPIEEGRTDDDAILERAIAAKNGDRLAALMAGSVAHGSASEADFALCGALSFWTRDPDQIERITRRSGLYRRKWETRRPGGTYISTTIAKALAAQSSNVGDAPRRRGRPTTTVKKESDNTEESPRLVVVEHCDECGAWKGDCRHA